MALDKYTNIALLPPIDIVKFLDINNNTYESSSLQVSYGKSKILGYKINNDCKSLKIKELTDNYLF